MDVIRLVRSIVTCLGLTLGWVEILGAFMQRVPTTREVYVSPPREFSRERAVVWKLLRSPCGWWMQEGNDMSLLLAKTCIEASFHPL